MFSSYLNRIGIIKRTTERLSRRRAAREPRAKNTLVHGGCREQPEIPDSSTVLEDEDYLLVDIRDDGTAEASRVDPGRSLGLVPSKTKVPNTKNIGTPAPRDKGFENIPL